MRNISYLALAVFVLLAVSIVCAVFNLALWAIVSAIVAVAVAVLSLRE